MNKRVSDLVLEHVLQAAFAFGTRLYVGWTFLWAGILKAQDWDSTLYLFESEYKVPLLPFKLAAWTGTAAELLFGALLIVGLGKRWTPAALFGVNAMAVVSYWHFLNGENGAVGKWDHIVWGFMLLMLALYGMGSWSLDTGWSWWRKRGK
jgi:putative oxidoreductase